MSLVLLLGHLTHTLQVIRIHVSAKQKSKVISNRTPTHTHTHTLKYCDFLKHWLPQFFILNIWSLARYFRAWSSQSSSWVRVIASVQTQSHQDSEKPQGCLLFVACQLTDRVAERWLRISGANLWKCLEVWRGKVSPTSSDWHWS